MHWGLFDGLLTFQPREKLRLIAFSVRREVLLECKKSSLKLYYRRNHCLVGLTENKIKAVYICLDFKKLGNTWMIDTYPFPCIKDVFAEIHDSSQDLQNAHHQITLLKRSRDLFTCISFSGFSV